jgi:pantoate--beta-alanine ligase
LKLYKEINELRKFLQSERLSGATIGFVPTMGALHGGHLSLIRASRNENRLTVCSIFVNPRQFNDLADLAKYPRTIENDIRLLVENGCDVVFHPEVDEMYPPDETPAEEEDYGFITRILEGKSRPGHFDGVITVVKKLLTVVEPDNAYFGQKDYQQCAVINRLITQNGLHTRLRICPTIREDDGLAMSSRNVLLKPEERKAAGVIPQTLQSLKDHFREHAVRELKESSVRRIHSSSPLLQVDYLEIADPVTLEPVEHIDEMTKAVALIAVRCGNVRLIDNLVLTD